MSLIELYNYFENIARNYLEHSEKTPYFMIETGAKIYESTSLRSGYDWSNHLGMILEYPEMQIRPVSNGNRDQLRRFQTNAFLIGRQCSQTEPIQELETKEKALALVSAIIKQMEKDFSPRSEGARKIYGLDYPIQIQFFNDLYGRNFSGVRAEFTLHSSF